MPLGEVKKIMTDQDEKRRMALMLALHCAPILLGIKAANILNVSPEELRLITGLLRGTEISFRYLKTRGGRGILLIYRRERLQAYLNRNDVREFLKNYGYEDSGLNHCLRRLSERTRLFGDGRTEFPHEIGVFLEYPIEDVVGFLENGGGNYLYTGYWKVYHDPKAAKLRFKSYDDARERAVAAVLDGRKIREVCA